jgi:hypothetical protein
MVSNLAKHRYLRFEKKDQPLLPRTAFLRRLVLATLLALAILASWVFIGMLGYRILAGLSWIDAFLNAAMIAGGMGPVDPLSTAASKVFAGTYAILSGVLFLVAFGLLIAPLFHRFLHRFHLDTEEEARDQSFHKSSS